MDGNMIKVAIDIPSFNGVGLTFNHTANTPVAYFTYLSQENNKQTPPIGVSTDGTDLFFFPDRSSSQRDILKKLSIAY